MQNEMMKKAFEFAREQMAAGQWTTEKAFEETKQWAEAFKREMMQQAFAHAEKRMARGEWTMEQAFAQMEDWATTFAETNAE